MYLTTCMERLEWLDLFHAFWRVSCMKCATFNLYGSTYSFKCFATLRCFGQSVSRSFRNILVAPLRTAENPVPCFHPTAPSKLPWGLDRSDQLQQLQKLQKNNAKPQKQTKEQPIVAKGAKEQVVDQGNAKATVDIRNGEHEPTKISHQPLLGTTKVS